MKLGEMDVNSENENSMNLQTYGEGPLPEHDYIHIERFQVSRAIWILIKTTEADKIIVAEKLDLFSRFLHLNILRGEGMDGENLILEIVANVISCFPFTRPCI